MTTKNEVVDSLTTQGKTASQEEAPPQTIIGTFPTLDSVLQAAIMAKNHVGFGLPNDILKKYGCKIADLPQEKWQEAGEWFDSLCPIIPTKVDGGSEGIIRPGKFASGGIVPDSIRKAVFGEPTLPGETIIPVVNEVSGKAYSDMIAAEQRRQTVQAEAMVNLAVGVVLSQQGITSVTITPHDLDIFQQEHSVRQEINSDGSFTIIVTEKE